MCERDKREREREQNEREGVRGRKNEREYVREIYKAERCTREKKLQRERERAKEKK